MEDQCIILFKISVKENSIGYLIAIYYVFNKGWSLAAPHQNTEFRVLPE